MQTILISQKILPARHRASSAGTGQPAFSEMAILHRVGGFPPASLAAPQPVAKKKKKSHEKTAWRAWRFARGPP
jgi:hypothetical protein